MLRALWAEVWGFGMSTVRRAVREGVRIAADEIDRSLQQRVEAGQLTPAEASRIREGVDLVSGRAARLVLRELGG